MKNKLIGIHVHNTLTVPCEKFNMVTFNYSRMKTIHAPSAQSRFPVKLICCNSIHHQLQCALGSSGLKTQAQASMLSEAEDDFVICGNAQMDMCLCYQVDV